MNVFVTKSTLYSISGVLEIDYDITSKACSAIEKIIHGYSKAAILTKSEISSLGNMIAINEILNNETPETIKTKKRKLITNAAMRERVVFISRHKTYHYYDNCPKITSDYQNFTIPDEIPEKSIEEYRKFFIENITTFTTNPDVFYFSANIKFGTNIKSIGKMHHRNSGKANTQDMLSILESDQEPCAKSISNALVFYQNNKRIVQKFGAASHLRDKLLNEGKMGPDEHKTICDWHLLKETVKAEIFQKITKINKITNHAYSSDILDAIGFTPCSTCNELKNR